MGVDCAAGVGFRFEVAAGVEDGFGVSGLLLDEGAGESVVVGLWVGFVDAEGAGLAGVDEGERLGEAVGVAVGEGEDEGEG